MCITFFRIDSDCLKGPYRLILIANRDEFYHRKSKPSTYWEDHPHILGGRDLSTESCGTWLAASIKGKIGVLLNIQEKLEPAKVESRGRLVSNFLNHDVSAEDYIKATLNGKEVYNGYHLILFSIMAKRVELKVLTNQEYGRKTNVTELFDGSHGISNSPIADPYQKVLQGKLRFDEIVNRYSSLEEKEIMVAELKKLLESKEKNYPDDVLYESKRDFISSYHIEKLSSIFVQIPEINYGTRTHTIILINSNNEMDWREFTMSNEDDSQGFQWHYKRYEAQVDVKCE